MFENIRAEIKARKKAKSKCLWWVNQGRPCNLANRRCSECRVIKYGK